MNIIKRFLNVVTLFGVIMVLSGIYEYFFESTSSTDVFAISAAVFGLVLFFNYILFQNISIWNKLEKKNN
jgi:hypothetical protein